jgi:hypothetical protein
VTTERVELPTTDIDYEAERIRAVEKLTPEGVKPLTDGETSCEHKLTKKLLKKAASNVLSFRGAGICFPVYYSEARSFLERIADQFSFLVFSYIPQMQSARTPESKLEFLTLGILSSLHMDMQCKKPWNPILGETYRCKWPNGVEFFAEQTSHHPPVSDVQIFPPDGSWACVGHCRCSVDNGVKTAVAEQPGLFRLQFAEGGSYEWEFPGIEILGNLSGTRFVRAKGPLRVFDRTNSIEFYVELNPKVDKKRGVKDPTGTSVAGYLRKGKKDSSDLILTGDYCGKLFLRGQSVWDIQFDRAIRPIASVADCELLRSDSRYRMDRNFFIQGNMEKADASKIALEELQRRDAKLRKHGMKDKKGHKKGTENGIPSETSSDTSAAGFCDESANVSDDASGDIFENKVRGHAE